jgi:uncharacterized protein (TIGR01244 family)
MTTPQRPDTASADHDIARLAGLRCPEPGCFCGGQPDAAQLTAAARAGLRYDISLRPATESAGYDEAAKAAELGVAYHCVPVAGPQDLTRDKVQQLDALLAQAGCSPTLIHCASGNRVGALMALRAGWLQGKSRTEAVEIGRRWGLLGLEPAVAALLD